MAWTDRPPLDHVVLDTLPAGTLVSRCFRQDRAPTAFWSATDVRFGAAPRAMLYTGDSDTAAVGETLLRDPRPYPNSRAVSLPYDHVRPRGLATLRLRRDAVLVRLTRPAITAVIEDRAHLQDVRALIETRAGYAETERFARALLLQVPTLEVLAWPSQRVDGQTVYCFYQGTIGPADFDVVEASGFDTDVGFARLGNAVAGANLILMTAAPTAGVPDDDP